MNLIHFELKEKKSKIKKIKEIKKREIMQKYLIMFPKSIEKGK